MDLNQCLDQLVQLFPTVEERERILYALLNDDEKHLLKKKIIKNDGSFKVDGECFLDRDKFTINFVRYLLHKNIDINSQISYHTYGDKFRDKTFLTYFIEKEDLEAIGFCLQKDAIIGEIDIYSALFINNKIEIADYIFRRTDWEDIIDDLDFIIMIVDRSNIELLKLFRRYSKQSYNYDAIKHCIKNKKFDILQYIVEDLKFNDPNKLGIINKGLFYLAEKIKFDDDFKKMFDILNSVKPNLDGALGACLSDVDQVRFLIKHGAKSTYLNSMQIDGLLKMLA